MSRATRWRTALGGPVADAAGRRCAGGGHAARVDADRGRAALLRGAPSRRGARAARSPSFLIGDCPYYRATLVSLLRGPRSEREEQPDRRALCAAVQRRARAERRLLSEAPDPAGGGGAAVLRRGRRRGVAGVQPGAARRAGAGDVDRGAPIRAGLGRVRGDDLVRVRDVAAVRRVQLRARRAVDVAGRRRRRRVALRPQPHGRGASWPVAVGEVDEPGVLPGRGGGAGGAARVARRCCASARRRPFR